MAKKGKRMVLQNGETARYYDEYRFVFESGAHVPARLTKDALEAISAESGDSFEICTVRRVYWSPRFEMCEKMAEWEKRQKYSRVNGKLVCLFTKIRLIDLMDKTSNWKQTLTNRKEQKWT